MGGDFLDKMLWLSVTLDKDHMLVQDSPFKNGGILTLMNTW